MYDKAINLDGNINMLKDRCRGQQGKPKRSELNVLVIWQFTSPNASATQLFFHSSVSLSHADLFPGC